MKHNIFIPLAIIILTVQALASIKVIESTPSRLVLSYELAGFDTASIHDGRDFRTRVLFDGGYVSTGDSGAALLPGYAIHVGVPRRGGMRVTVEPEELSVVRVANPLRRRDFAADSAGEPVFTSRWISDAAYGAMRHYNTARLVLRPVYDMGQGRVQLLRRARIVIDFPAAAHSGASWEPRGSYERMVGALLSNFTVAQGWHDGRRGLRRAAEVQGFDPYPFEHSQRLASFRVGPVNRNVNEASTENNKLIKISVQSIRELFPDAPLSSVALYASIQGEMDVTVPGVDSIPAGVFEVPLIRGDDYFIAYVGGTSDWSYNANWRQYIFSLNRLDDQRTYWLAVKRSGSGLTMERFLEPPADSAPVDNFESNLFLRSPGVLSGNNEEGGTDWAWRRFTVGRADTTIRLDLPGLERGRAGSIQFRNGRIHNPSTAGAPASTGTISARLGGNELCAVCGIGSVEVDSWPSDDLLITYTHSHSNTRAYLEVNSLHVRYPSTLAVSDAAGRLEVFSSTTSGTVGYRLSKESGERAYVVRVPIDGHGVTLIDIVGAERAYHTWNDAGNEGTRYLVTLEKDIVDYSDSLRIFTALPTVNSTFQIRDLRAANETDYLIVTHEDFLAASIRLAEHKARVGFGRPRIVLLGDILQQFGGGNMDPAAIRNFLLYVYRHWNGGDEFSYVVLMGSGHYDYKYVSTRNPNFMPVPYINGRLNEDFYVLFNTMIHPSSQHSAYYFLGRLPAKSPAQAFDMVDKIIEMEDPRVANFDSWRNRVLMSADDDQQGPNEDNIKDHVNSSERLSAIIERNRPEVDLRKLYLYEFEWDERWFKPSATRTLINEINSGVALFNWFGHGGMEVIADERLLSTTDIGALSNRGRYPVITLFSCSVGKFDQPGRDCIAELLVRQPRAGAIASISGARLVVPRHNEGLAAPFFEALFSLERQSANFSIGSALRYAKHMYTVSHESKFYVILGDPSITFSARNRGVDLRITSISDPAVTLDTLKALQRISIRGAVTDLDGLTDANFSGTGAFVNLTLSNPPFLSRRKDGGIFSGKDSTWMLPGRPVFSAKIPVSDGEFEQQLLLPMNLAFGQPGVRLTAYAWKEGDTLTGGGYLGGLIFEGSETADIGDTVGPKISVRPIFNDVGMNRAGLFVRNRITSQLPLNVEIAIEGQNGINVIGTGPDEGLTIEVRGALSKRSVNHLFQFSEGSFSRGTANIMFEENQLRGGSHELVISAQDLLGNASKLTVALDIVDPAELKLDHVINVPNPVRMGRETRFFYHHSNTPGDLNVDVTIRIYSLGGRLLAVIRNPENGVPWVPRDGRGNLLSPNVYLYQVTATSPNIGKTVRSRIKKLVVHPPR
ncbi:MAG: C25 family cysteine peptidase [Chitinispirillales bacterium]|jgi:hypothetical protein|nr:C25 family cysteine peptidase [Chitinispirillales bacterium]